jgi:hypothetical protein
MTARPSARSDIAAVIAVAAFGALNVGFGFWALLDPQSFFDNIAEFEPYNEHFLHDLGAFQLGIGATLCFALLWRGDALLAALGGGAAGATAHEVAHIFDEDLGGKSSDPFTLGIIALLLVAVFGWRLWERYATRPQ